jgi:hypothetical protein
VLDGLNLGLEKTILRFLPGKRLSINAVSHAVGLLTADYFVKVRAGRVFTPDVSLRCAGIRSRKKRTGTNRGKGQATGLVCCPERSASTRPLGAGFLT